MNLPRVGIGIGISGLVLAGLGVVILGPTTETSPIVTTSDFTEEEKSAVPEQSTPPQIGMNFIRVFLDDETESNSSFGPREPVGPEYLDEPEWIFEDLEALGVQVVRQATEGDLFWSNVEPQDDEWNFEKTDAWLLNNPYEPIVTVFAMQYASATPPWESDSAAFQKTFGPEAQEYLDAILDRYADVVTYWEIGNEMDHWRIADPGEQAPASASETPLSMPEGGFSPYEQGVFIAQVADYIRGKDNDAVIVLPGMSGLDTYLLDVWLPGVVEGAGTEAFDVVNYHYYGDSSGYPRARERLASTLQELGLSDKPVWLTETGVTSDPTLTQRTDYPNSEETQAAEVFRRLIQAYAAGDSLVLWHTHVSSSDAGSKGDWRAYGLRTMTGEIKPAWTTFQQFTTTFIPFERVETISNEDGASLYEVILVEGTSIYVAWGEGTIELPKGVTEWAETVSREASLQWFSIEEEDRFELSDLPIVLK